jgi:predicted ATPase
MPATRPTPANGAGSRSDLPVTRLILLTGMPGAGKTTLIDMLAAMGHTVVREAATDVIARQQAAGTDAPWLDPAFIVDLLDLQLERLGDVRESGAPVAFCDRSPVCTLALARFLGHPVPHRLSEATAALAADPAVGGTAVLVEGLGYITNTPARRISLPEAQVFEAVHVTAYTQAGIALLSLPPTPPAERADALVRLVAGRC